jgi:hypothetical protein
MITMPKNKQYKIDVPVDGENESVTYEVSGTGEITVKKVGDEDGSDLSPAEKAKIVKAIKAAPHPGNELPDREGATDPGYGKPEGGSGGRPDNTLPGQGGRPDQGLPGDQPGIDNTLPGQGGRPDQGLPGNQPGIDNSLPGGGANPNLDPNLDPNVRRPGAGTRPDNTLPGEQPEAGNELPEQPTTPDNTLPETPEPK